MLTVSRAVLVAGVCFAAALAAAPQTGKEAPPKVQLNFLNVCTPPAAEQKQMAAALDRVPLKPAFAVDMEIARGRTTMPDAPLSRWVRIRREFPAQVSFSNVQYTFNVDDKAVAETLVFRTRDPRQGEALQLSIDDKVTAGTPAAVLASDTPAARVKLERYGQSSLALARCPAVDQSGYQPLFERASQLLAAYRTALHVRQTVPGDLARLEGSPSASASSRPASRGRKAAPRTAASH